MYIAIVELKNSMDLLYEFVKGIIWSAYTKSTCVSGSPEPQKY
jgi:hypothetical protein